MTGPSTVTASQHQAAARQALPPAAVLAGDDELSTLSIIRALLAHGVSPLLLSGGRRWPLAATLANVRLVLTPGVHDGFELHEALQSLGSVWRWRYDGRILLLATDEAGGSTLMRAGDQLRSYFVVFGDVAERDYGRFADRASILDAVRGLNGALAVPKTFICRRREDGDAVVDALSFPCTVRPVARDGGPGCVADDAIVFRAYLSRWIADFGPVIVQRQIMAGYRVLHCAYRSREGHTAGMTLRTLRTYRDRPSSVVTEATPVVREAAARALHALNLWGPATVEFVVEPATATCWLTDIGPHWIAPMQLGAAAGLDFVQWMLQERSGEPVWAAEEVASGLTWVDPWTNWLSRTDSPRHRFRSWRTDVHAATVRTMWGASDRAILWRWVLRRPYEILRRLAG
jgi:predicted ATP-grasp superfamily ATP-dependent carboligase